MLPATSTRYTLWIQGFCFFIAAAFILTGGGYNMIIDSDPLWHVAAGDLIRAQGTIPASDPWSFTAGDYRWLNVSWLWDMLFSIIVQHLGWEGAAAINGIIIAALLAITYVHCVLRSGNGMASFFSVVLIFIMFHLHLRPVHVTHFMIALWMLMLGLIIRSECKAYWLALLPASMLVWVNSHGGFILGFVILGLFTSEAILLKKPQRNALLATCAACAIAALCNPYGFGIIETVLRPLTTVANQYITEWQPFTTSPMNLLTCAFIVLFVALVVGRKTHATPAEATLAYLFLLYGLTTNRALYAFTLIAAPMLAYHLAPFMRETKAPNDSALRIRQFFHDASQQKHWLFVALSIAVFTPPALLVSVRAGIFPQQTGWPDIKEEIAFVTKHYPDNRFITDFNLSGYIVYETRGKLPVFVDPRTETAFPREVMADYFTFLDGTPDWDRILDKYDIKGCILFNKTDQALHDRLKSRKGWKTAFKGDAATIYVRTSD